MGQKKEGKFRSMHTLNTIPKAEREKFILIINNNFIWRQKLRLLVSLPIMTRSVVACRLSPVGAKFIRTHKREKKKKTFILDLTDWTILMMF